jgi:hypothetical protein
VGSWGFKGEKKRKEIVLTSQGITAKNQSYTQKRTQNEMNCKKKKRRKRKETTLLVALLTGRS